MHVRPGLSFCACVGLLRAKYLGRSQKGSRVLCCHAAHVLKSPGKIAVHQLKESGPLVVTSSTICVRPRAKYICTISKGELYDGPLCPRLIKTSEGSE